MRRPPRRSHANLLDRSVLTRAWLWLGVVEAALVMGGFLWVLLREGWALGDPTGPGTPLHDAHLTAMTMTFAGIVACQVGAAFACRTERASLRTIGLTTNRLLLWGIAFELVFAAAIIYLPPLQPVFDSAPLGPAELAVLATFPVVVWGVDELRRWALRGRDDATAGTRGH
jgi:magnesium-transporting ATPase (P-type)